MLVTYEYEGESSSFDIEDGDELSEMLAEAARELGSRHPGLASRPGLVAAVADRMLDCLCDNAEFLDLGPLP